MLNVFSLLLCVKAILGLTWHNTPQILVPVRPIIAQAILEEIVRLDNELKMDDSRIDTEMLCAYVWAWMIIDKNTCVRYEGIAGNKHPGDLAVGHTGRFGNAEDVTSSLLWNGHGFKTVTVTSDYTDMRYDIHNGVQRASFGIRLSMKMTDADNNISTFHYTTERDFSMIENKIILYESTAEAFKPYIFSSSY